MDGHDRIAQYSPEFVSGSIKRTQRQKIFFFQKEKKKRKEKKSKKRVSKDCTSVMIESIIEIVPYTKKKH